MRSYLRNYSYNEIWLWQYKILAVNMAESSYLLDQEDCDIWEIPDKYLCEEVKAVFSSTNSLLCYCTKNEKCGVSSGSQLYSPFVHEVKYNTTLHNQYTRKLVNESHGIFLAASKLAKDSNERIKCQQLVKISQKYRSVLMACIEDLESAIGKEEADDDIVEQRSMFAEIEAIWSLLEVLFIDIQSSHRILYRLLEWIQWHCTDVEQKLGDVLKSDEPSQHSSYWEIILQFVLQGKITFARSTLKVHTNANREDFRSMDELLGKMPFYMCNVGFSLTEFRMRWRHWQDECKRRLYEGEFSAVDNLEILCKFLCGDKDTFNEKSYLCGTWYHLLISTQFYTDPCITAHELGNLARSFSSSILTPDTPATNVDIIILAAMELDIMKVIKDSCKFHDGWWFISHITDLLYKGDYINAETVSYSACLREFLISNYADSLMTHRSLWQAGVDYLDQCQEVGKDYLEMYLERIPIETEAKARKVLYIAKQRNMENLVKSICKVMTVRAIKNEKFGTALGWVVQSKDVRFATDLANRWMKEYSDTGKFECFEILNNLGFCMLVSDKLTFVGKYCEFHKLYQEKEFKLAASLLVSLLSSGLVPKQFQMVMLLDALPLLEASDPVFSMQETYQLMACLEGLSSRDKDNKEETNGLKKKECLIRLALGRNLARAFIEEGSVS